MTTSAAERLSTLAAGMNQDGTIPSSIAPGAGGAPPVTSVNGAIGAVVLAASDVGAQPLDSDLTAIAALTTTAYGRAFLALADAAAARAALALGTAATSATGAFDAAGAASAAQSASQPLDADLTSIAALATTAYGRAFLVLADAAAGRLAIGTTTLYNPGSFSVATENYALMGNHLILTSTGRATLAGTARLRII